MVDMLLWFYLLVATLCKVPLKMAFLVALCNMPLPILKLCCSAPARRWRCKSLTRVDERDRHLLLQGQTTGPSNFPRQVTYMNWGEGWFHFVISTLSVFFVWKFLIKLTSELFETCSCINSIDLMPATKRWIIKLNPHDHQEVGNWRQRTSRGVFSVWRPWAPASPVRHLFCAFDFRNNTRWSITENLPASVPSGKVSTAYFLFWQKKTYLTNAS
jgi:hypothetical protein